MCSLSEESKLVFVDHRLNNAKVNGGQIIVTEDTTNDALQFDVTIDKDKFKLFPCTKVSLIDMHTVLID